MCVVLGFRYLNVYPGLSTHAVWLGMMQISFFRYSALHLSGQSWCAFELLRTILIQQFCLTWILSLISSCLSRKNFFPFFWGSPFRQTATTLLPSSSSAILNVWNLSVREKKLFFVFFKQTKKGETLFKWHLGTTKWHFENAKAFKKCR